MVAGKPGGELPKSVKSSPKLLSSFQTDTVVVRLKTSGNIFDKGVRFVTSSIAGGIILPDDLKQSEINERLAKTSLLATIYNYKLRGHLWKIERVAFHETKSQFLLGDARGQIYVFSLDTNSYEIGRLASTPIASMCFLHSKPNEIVVSYESGETVIINTSTKAILHTLNIVDPLNWAPGTSAVRLMRCHPKKELLLMAADNKTVSLWDVKTMKITHCLECTENIVDVRFELGGGLIALVLEETGVYFYRTSDCELVCECPLPDSERNPKWTAYCSHIVSLSFSPEGGGGKGSKRSGMVGKGKNEGAMAALTSNERDKVSIRVFVTGDNGKIYIWNLYSFDLAENLPINGPHKASLLGIVELPAKVQEVVGIMTLRKMTISSSRLGLVTNNGDFIILDEEDAGAVSTGAWIVAATLPTTALHGDLGRDVSLKHVTVPPCEKEYTSHHNISNSQVNIDCTTSSAALAVSAFMKSGFNNESEPDRSRGSKCVDSLVATDGKFLVSIGLDGAARVFDSGMFPVKYRGILLQSRRPYPPLSIATRAVVNPTSSSSSPSSSSSAPHTSSSIRNGKPSSPVSVTAAGGATGWSVRAREDNKENNLTEATLTLTSAALTGNKAINRDNSIAFEADERSEISNNRINNFFESQSQGNDDEEGDEDDDGISKKGNIRFSIDNTDGFKSQASDILANQPLMTSLEYALQNQEQGTQSGHLFELSSLSVKEQLNNELKVREFFESHGVFPEKYRPFIWQFILKLPDNQIAYASLSRKGMHPAALEMCQRVPIRSQHISFRLHETCSALCHWSPVLAHASYLPQLIFPFLHIWPSNDVAVLEASMTLLMWWGYSWHSAYPSGPQHIMDAFAQLLLHHDPRLYYHFEKLKANVGEICWNMLSTVFTEVFSRTCWLLVMDFLVMHFDNSGYAMLVPIAVLKCVRSTLLGCASASHMVPFLRSQQTVKGTVLVKMLKEMMTSSPPKHYSALSGPVSIEGPPSHLVEAAEDAREDARQARGDRESDIGSNVDDMMNTGAIGRPMFPLTAGRYPQYDGYPRFLLEWESKHAKEEALLQGELQRKQKVVATLEKTVAKVCFLCVLFVFVLFVCVFCSFISVSFLCVCVWTQMISHSM